MHPFLSFRVHVNQRPMQIIKVNIVQLHKSKWLLELEHRIWVNVVEWFSGDKKVLPFNSVFGYDSFDGFSQWNLIIIISCSIYVFAIPHLKSLPQQASQQDLILDLISPESYKM